MHGETVKFSYACVRLPLMGTLQF